MYNFFYFGNNNNSKILITVEFARVSTHSKLYQIKYNNLQINEIVR